MRWLVFAAFAPVLIACGTRNDSNATTSTTSQKQKQERFFTDISETSGIRFVHDPGVDGSYFMPESVGSGAAFLDFDNDSDLDIYLINSGTHNNGSRTSQNHLYRDDANKYTDITGPPLALYRPGTWFTNVRRHR